MKKAKNMEPIVVILDPGALRAAIIFFCVCTAIFTIAAIANDGFLGWSMKLFAVLFVPFLIWFGRARRKGYLQGCLAADSKGIRNSGQLYPWKAIVYISKYSQIRKTSEKAGIYIGESLGLCDDEFNISEFFKEEEFDYIIQSLNKMREFYRGQ